MRRGQARRSTGAWVVGGWSALALVGGCQTQAPTRPDAFDAGLPVEPAAPPPKDTGPVTTERVQTQVMDFADDFTLRLADVTDRIEARNPPMETRNAIHRLRYTVAHGLTVIAAGHNPRVSLIDMVVVMSLQTRLVEERLVPRYFQDMPWLAATFRNGAEQVRGYAAQSLSVEQLAEIDALVDRWMTDNEYRYYAAYVRLEDFAGARQETESSGKGRTPSIFNLLFLDPLAGLDPTTREIEQSRMFAERAMYYLQRMPELVSWQAELLYLDTAAEPEVTQVLLNFESLSESIRTLTDDITAVRNDLPALVERERAAAIDQASERFFEGFASERAAMLAELSKPNQVLAGTLEDFTKAFEAGDGFSGSATELVKSVQALTDTLRHMRGQEGEGPGGATIADYERSIQSATTLTQRLDTLVGSIDALSKSDAWEARRATIDGVAADAQARLESVVDRAYRRALVLVGVLLAGALVVGLVLKLVPGRGAHGPR